MTRLFDLIDLPRNVFWLVVAMAVYEVVANDMARAVTGIIQWLPMVLFPLIACQVYSAAGRVEMAVFFWSTRRQPAAHVS